MAERIEEPEVEAEEALDQASPAAVSLALGRAGKGDQSVDAEAVAFLRDQRRLINLQTEHLHEQRELQLGHLKVRRWKDRMSLALQALGVLVGVMVVIGLAVMAWQAHEDHGLVIDAFSVPPDLARDGLTGDVAAARFLDKLQALQTQTAESDRPAKSFQNDWGTEIKVEIPETGLTFGEFEKLLREKLGHVSHVSGEVLKTPDGIALTARIGDSPPQTFMGPEASFDDLAQKAAEAVFRISQTYRYAEYLDLHGRAEEAFPVIADLATNGPASERGWAYAEWAELDLNDHGDVASALAHAGRGLGFGPGSDLKDRISLVNTSVWSGHDEANLELSRVVDAESQQRLPETSDVFYSENKLLGRAWLQFSEPDFEGSAETWRKIADEHPAALGPMGHAMASTALALAHDPAGAHIELSLLRDPDETSQMWPVATGAFLALPVYWTAAEAGDWPSALADVRHVDAWLDANRAQRPIYGLMQKTWIWPLEALAQAKTGDIGAAQTLIGRTPLDCYLCVRVRGRIAAGAKDWPSAERWFADAVRQAPSFPFAYVERGEMRLARGQADAAIGDAQAAAEKAPKFADAPELWGEALMQKGDYAAALDKLRAARKLAPSWPRNRLALQRAQLAPRR